MRPASQTPGGINFIKPFERLVHFGQSLTVRPAPGYGSIMQTFLPFKSFVKTAGYLDRMRLGKQRVETFQLLRALNGETKGWVNHPAAVMWRGHEASLAMYGCIICDEWKRRGYKDTMTERIAAYFDVFGKPSDCGPPPWLGDKNFHLSHQSNLIRKFPEFYSSKFPGVPDDLPYIWPVMTLSS